MLLGVLWNKIYVHYWFLPVNCVVCTVVWIWELCMYKIEWNTRRYENNKTNKSSNRVAYFAICIPLQSAESTAEKSDWNVSGNKTANIAPPPKRLQSRLIEWMETV